MRSKEKAQDGQSIDIKQKVVRRYVDRRLGVGLAVVGGIMREPSLTQDDHYRQFGIRSSVTLYKLRMYELGISPSNIMGGVRGLQESAERGEDGASNAFTTAVAASHNILERTGNARYEGRPTTATVLKPGVEELVKIRPR